MRVSPALAIVTATVLAVPSGAVAASSNPNSTKVVGATAAVSSCGSLSGTRLSWTVVENVVTALTVTSIPATCSGATLSVTLVGSGNTSLGDAGPVTITGTSQSIPVPGSPTSTSVSAAYMSVVGP